MQAVMLDICRISEQDTRMLYSFSAVKHNILVTMQQTAELLADILAWMMGAT